MSRQKDPGPVSSRTLAVRRYRDANPDYRDRERRRVIARNEALSALARKHPAEFAALYEAELRHAGLWPLRPSGRPRKVVVDVQAGV